jgi:hypothetical protein
MPHICERLVAAAKYLEAQGMSAEQLQAVHHSKRRKETFAGTYRYFGEAKELKAKNTLYAKRLIYLEQEHRRGQRSISSLVEAAIQQWPLSP